MLALPAMNKKGNLQYKHSASFALQNNDLRQRLKDILHVLLSFLDINFNEQETKSADL